MAIGESAAARLLALRKAMGWAQSDIIARNGGAFDQSDYSKMEGGRHKATSYDVRVGLARAYGLDLAEMVAYLTGRRDLARVLERARPPALPAGARTATPAAPSPVLRVVEPAGASATAPEDPGARLERALGAAFDPGRHTIGDATAVLDALRGAAVELADEALPVAARRWLDVAAALRTEGRALTHEALIARLTLATP